MASRRFTILVLFAFPCRSPKSALGNFDPNSDSDSNSYGNGNANSYTETDSAASRETEPESDINPYALTDTLEAI